MPNQYRVFRYQEYMRHVNTGQGDYVQVVDDDPFFACIQALSQHEGPPVQECSIRFVVLSLSERYFCDVQISVKEAGKDKSDSISIAQEREEPKTDAAETTTHDSASASTESVDTSEETE